MSTVNALRLALDARPAVQGAQQFEGATRRVAQSAGTADTSLRGVDTRMSRLGRTAGGLRRVLAGVGLGFSAFMVLRDAIGVMRDFEETMITVKGVSQATETEFQKLSAIARELGASTRWSAQEAGEGLLFLSRAGFSVQEQIQALPSTLDLATAGTLQLGQAADIASNVLAQFQLEAEQMDRVADSLVTTANNANTSVEQLAQGLTYAGPVAGALNISLEETNAALGVLGDAGIQGGRAGTNLRGIFSSLLDVTDKTRDAINRLGLSVGELDPQVHDIDTIFSRLQSSGMSAADAVEIFGRRNAAAAIIIAGSTEKMRELHEAQEQNKGSAAELAELMDTSLAGSFKELRSAIEESYLTAGEGGLVGGIRQIVDWVTWMVRAFMDAGDKIDIAAANMSGNLLQIWEWLRYQWNVFTNNFQHGWKDAVKFIAAELLYFVEVATDSFAFLERQINRLPGVQINAMQSANEWIQKQREELYKNNKVTENAIKLYEEYQRKSEGIDQATTQRITEIMSRDQVVGLREPEPEVRDRTSDPGRAEEIERQVQATQEELNTREQVSNQIQSMFDDLTRERELIGLTNEERNIALKMLEMEAAAKDKYGEDQQKINQTLTDYYTLLREVTAAQREHEASLEAKEEQKRREAELTRERERAARVVNQSLDSLRRELELIGLTNDERERAEKLIEFEAAAKVKYGENQEAINRATEEYMGLLDQLKQHRELQEIADGIGRSFGRAFEDMVLGAKSASDAMKGLAQDVLRLLIRQQYTQPLANMVTGFFSPEAHTGGVVGATSFPMRRDNPAMYAHAKRYHTGLKSDEFRAILQQGETILPKDFKPTAPSVEVNVINESGQPVDATERRSRFDGRKMVVDVVLNDLQNFGQIHQTIKRL